MTHVNVNVYGVNVIVSVNNPVAYRTETMCETFLSTCNMKYLRKAELKAKQEATAKRLKTIGFHRRNKGKRHTQDPNRLVPQRGGYQVNV